MTPAALQADGDLVQMVISKQNMFALPDPPVSAKYICVFGSDAFGCLGLRVQKVSRMAGCGVECGGILLALACS